VAQSSETISAVFEDTVAANDEPLDPSPRLTTSEEASLASLGGQGESTGLKPVPIEVWTEETMIINSSPYDDGRDDDKDELCVGDEPLDPSPRTEVDTSESGRVEKSALDLIMVDPTSTITEDNAEVCVEDLLRPPSAMDMKADETSVNADDLLSELSPPSEMDAFGPGKPEERSSSVDEDRDVDTTETSSRSDNVVVGLLPDTSKWNGVDVGEPSSTLLNGYPDDDVRM